MRNAAICGARIRERFPLNASIATLDIDGVAVTAGLIETADAVFDAGAPENASRVLVRVRAFSCNYRDKSFVMRMATRGPATSFYVIGSEFVADVLDVGAAVTALRPGDRVISDHAYPQARSASAPAGVPTNHASKERLILHEAKLRKLPDGMTDATAAAFSLGAQTAYGLVRKLRLQPGEKVLVTAARSNTSLFVLQALRHQGVEVYATTRATTGGDTLRAMGVREIITLDPASVSSGGRIVSEVAEAIGGFDAVIDPFFDLHFGRVVYLLAQGGRYVTCGLHDQTSHIIGRAATRSEVDLTAVMVRMITRNLQVMGHCLGSTDDLARALDDHAAGRLDVLVDSVYDGEAVAPFLERTFCAPDRLGKVVFRYA